MICQSIFVSAFKPSNLVKRLASCSSKSANLFVNAGKIPTNRVLLAKTRNASFPLVQWSRSIHGSHSLRKMLQNPEMQPPPEPTSENDVRERVLKAIKAWDRFPQDRADKLTLEARMSEDLSFDSLDMVEIVMSLEDEFGIEIKQEDAETFKTPNDAADFIIKFTGISDTEEF